MTLTLSLPVVGLIALTVIAFCIAEWQSPEPGTFGTGALVGCLFYMIAAVVVLSAWLIWALFR